ncbi:uncharacterized protein LDX57_010668 [Aspergillus melleus]|uniref:uncharacterized protein n=1 Tax=Aspergillus melleus TaxID=138277 RepID=UPI001E8ED073|nr:uncharacterized protein LDX57_010668 [Aspergillus melleus]KAH8433030.1 hypothetical protein LDX57_010668 [Aspergillus melleus]
MKPTIILPLLALFSAGFAVALPAAEAQDPADPESDPGDVGTEAVIPGVCTYSSALSPLRSPEARRVTDVPHGSS